MNTLHRLRRACLRRLYMWLIDGDLDYLEQCKRDGLIDSLSVREFRREIAQRELRLIELQEPMRGGA